ASRRIYLFYTASSPGSVSNPNYPSFLFFDGKEADRKQMKIIYFPSFPLVFKSEHMLYLS
ncbi:MAG: hypothetical protein U0N55_10085, partial [Streptococcus salivarius]